MLKIKNHNIKGFAHTLVPLLFIVIIAIVGVGYMVASHAANSVKTPPPIPAAPGSSKTTAASLSNQVGARSVATASTSTKLATPTAIYAAKGAPLAASATASAASVTPPPNVQGAFYYAGVKTSSPGVGFHTLLTVNSPPVSSADGKGAHSIAEVAAITGSDNANDPSSATRNIVEIGWIIDPSTYGDQIPRLFVFHWIKGQPTCYNACGYVQTSTKYAPGMKLWPDGSLQHFSVYYYYGNWWLNFAGEWIGYFPGSLWTSQGVNFNRFDYIKVFGEVGMPAAKTPCTDMGSGDYGNTLKGAQTVQSYNFGFGPSFYVNLAQFYSNGWYYNTGGPNYFGGVYFGGRGGC